jgi:hypothetical protein
MHLNRDREELTREARITGLDLLSDEVIRTLSV